MPCPDVVSKRVFEIATATEDDVHVDLGCGDGRLNFMAVDGSTRVGKSWGVDVDENILTKCYERLGRRFVPPKKKRNGEEEEEEVEESLLEFVKADLVEVIELQKELHQQQQSQQLLGENDDAAIEKSDKIATTNISNDAKNESLQSITHKIANSTIITMYFVDNALQQIQPYLSSILGGKKNVRVITIGYEMPNKDGWNASWVERVLGLTIFRYDMENISRSPLDWSLKSDDDDDGDDGSNGKLMSGNDIMSSTGDNDQDVEEFLRRKRQEDIEELNRGLRIHHDEELDEFAHARAKKQGLSANSGSTLILEEEDGDEWGDFDETEEPEELMKEAQRRMMEDRKASRGKIMAGVGGERKKSSRSGSAATAMKKPTWKKP